MKQIKKPETSKILAFIGMTMWIIANFFGMYMIRMTGDLTPLGYIIGSVDAVVAVITSFYFWKARAENQIKLQRESTQDISENEISPIDEMHWELK